MANVVFNLVMGMIIGFVIGLEFSKRKFQKRLAEMRKNKPKVD